MPQFGVYVQIVMDIDFAIWILPFVNRHGYAMDFGVDGVKNAIGILPQFWLQESLHPDKSDKV